jgi:uncharacterized cupredoxin-like copper-binding protein
MSMSRRRRAPSRWPALSRLLIAGFAALALLGGGLGRGAPVYAQDASPEASPVTGPCDAPALPPGTPTPRVEGSPVAEMPGAEEAAPAASPEAGTPADEATTQTAVAAVQNIVNCLNSGNYEGVAALFTPNMVRQIAGTTNPYDVLDALQGLVFRDFQTDGVATYADGRLSIEVTYLETEYQYVHERWWLVQDGDYWKLDGYDTLTPEPAGDTAVVGVALGSPDNEYSITPNTDSVTQSPVLIFHATNAGKEAHMLAVLKLPAGATIDQVMQDESLQQQTEFIGSIDYLAPGEAQDLALVNLPPGAYTLICFFPAPDGKTHAEHGMVTTFTVNPASS